MADRGRGRGRGGPPSGRGSSPAGGRGSSPSGRGGRGAERGGRGFERGAPGGGGRGAFRGGGRGGGPGGPVIFKENVPPRIPDYLSPSNQDKLVAVLRKVPKAPQRPTRPGFGTAGTPITLRSNFFPLTTGLDKLYDYSVQIEPQQFLRKHKARLFELIEESPQVQPHRPYIAHDGTQRLIAAKKIPDIELTVPFFERGQNGPPPNADVYRVSITLIRELNVKEMKRHVACFYFPS